MKKYVDKYCDGCQKLNPSESKQMNSSIHICEKYHKQVKHLGRHPRILRLTQCIDEDEKEV